MASSTEVQCHSTRVTRLCTKTVLREIEACGVTEHEWDVLQRHMVAALVACGVVTEAGADTHEGLLLGTFHHINMVKLVIPPALPTYMGTMCSGWVNEPQWTLSRHASTIVHSGLLPWRAHVWRVQAPHRECVLFRVVEFVQTTLARATTTTKATGDKQRSAVCALDLHVRSGVTRLDAMFSLFPRVWFVPRTGSWWNTLEAAQRHHHFSRLEVAQMHDPAFAPFLSGNE